MPKNQPPVYLTPDPNLPMPYDYYIRLGIASRATLHRWGLEGLQIMRKGGRSYITTSEITRFITEHATADPATN